MSIKLKNISKKFNSGSFFKQNSSIVLENLNLELNKGDILGVVGPNGAGKTTLFKIMLGLIEPTNGTINLDDKENKYFAYVNTNSRSFYWRLSSKDNLIFYGKLLNLSEKEINLSIKNLSQKFEVESLLEIPFMKLSSGQMQTMLIIRSLLKKPDYLIFDEATTSMDIEKSNKVLIEIKKFINESDIPTIWCSHNIEEIEFMCNNFSLLMDGKFKLLSEEDFKKFKKKLSNYNFEIRKKDFEKIAITKKIKIVNHLKDTCIIKFEDKSLSIKDCINVFINNEVDILEIINTKNVEDFSYE